MLSAPHLIVTISARLASMGEWKLQIEGELVFVEIRNTGYRPREIDWTIALRKQSKFGSRG